MLMLIQTLTLTISLSLTLPVPDQAEILQMKQSNPRSHNRHHLLLILTFFQLQQVLAVSSQRDWLPT